jgi:hypothetical protein
MSNHFSIGRFRDPRISRVTRSRVQDPEKISTSTRNSERLRPALLGYESTPPYQDIIEKLGLTVWAVRMAAHRLPMRYCERLREEIDRNVAEPSEIDAEIRALLVSRGR